MYGNYKLDLKWDDERRGWRSSYNTEVVGIYETLKIINGGPHYNKYIVEEGEIHFKQSLLTSRLIKVLYGV